MFCLRVTCLRLRILLCDQAAVKPAAPMSVMSDSEEEPEEPEEPEESDGCEVVEAATKGGRKGKVPGAKAKAVAKPAEVIGRLIFVLL